MRRFLALLAAAPLASASIFEIRGENPHVVFQDENSTCTLTYTEGKLISDCGLDIPALPPSFSRPQRLGTPKSELLSNSHAGGNMLDASPSGTFIYSVGSTMGAVGPRLAYSSYQGYIMKHYSTGAKEWAVQMGHSTPFHPAGVAVGPSGSAYMVGTLKGVHLKGVSQAPNYLPQGIATDIALLKFDSEGHQEWATSCCGSPLWEEPFGVRTDHSGNVYVIATSRAAAAISDASADVLVIKYSSSGDEIWRTTIESPGWDQPSGATFDAAQGTIVIAGTTTGRFDGNTHERCASFGGICTTADKFLVKIEVEGGIKVFSTQWGSSEIWSDDVHGVAADASGNVYVTGTDYSTFATLGSKTRGYLTKFDKDGNKVYTTYIGAANGYDGNLKVKSASLFGSSIYVAGENKGGAFVGFYNPGTADSNDLWVAKLSTVDGSMEWVQQIGGPLEDYSPLGLAAVFDGVIVQALTTSPSFAGLPSIGEADVVLFKYSQDGVMVAA